MSFLSQEFDQVVREHGDRTALVDEAGKLWTYVQLSDEVGRLSKRIRDKVPGKTVGILLLNSQRYLISMLAIWRAGKTAVPLNYLLPPQDLGFILQDSGMSGLIASKFFDEALTKIRPLFGDRGKILMADDPDLLPEGDAGGDAADQDPALILYTSGTTGRPKGVVLTHDNLVSDVRSCRQAGDFGKDDRFLCLLPFFHTYAITGTILLPLLNGAKMVLVDRFQPLKVLGLIAEHRITCFLAIPSMYRVLAMTDDDSDVSSVRFPISGGEPLPVATAEAFRKRFGVDIFDGYGQTEAAPVVSLNVPGGRKAGTVGRALPGVDIAIWNDQKQSIPANEIGEIMVRGPNVMAGYHKLPEETAKTITDGWLHTGDLGHIDDEGFVTITGRKKDLIISAGENIYPREIEEALIEHPSVKEVADEKELRGFCREHIAAYKVPRIFEIVTDLPRNATGKVLKRMLK